MILGAHHAQITIPTAQESAAREFYCTFLGLREIDKPEPIRARGGFWLNAGTIQVHVSLEDGVDRAKTKAHVAYLVSDLGGWRARLAARGIEAKDGTPIPGYERFEFRDPFGNRVEFIQTQESDAPGR
jgi:catechol 2,3-dioxygenase-like lactoylglutathione lyase family enzyme